MTSTARGQRRSCDRGRVRNRYRDRGSDWVWPESTRNRPNAAAGIDSDADSDSDPARGFCAKLVEPEAPLSKPHSTLEPRAW